MLSQKALIMPCIVHFIVLWTLNHFVYIAAELNFWLEKIAHLIMAVKIVTCIRKFSIYGKYLCMGTIP